jgi:hypothetical protein
MRCRPVVARLTEVADFDILLSHPPLIHRLFYVFGDDFSLLRFFYQALVYPKPIAGPSKPMEITV